MDVNRSIVKTLEHIGVAHVFGGSGQVNASMLLALRESAKIKTVIVRNEQAASFMACGYGMYSDKLGVCFATGGPGAFNLFSGLAVALSDSLPVLAITGYTSRGQRGKGALNESTGLHRTPDSHAMFAATTKKSYILEDPADTCDILEEAINIAYEGRPGPVHIHVPKDITVAEVPNFREIELNIKLVTPKERDAAALVESLADALAGGRRILAILGYGIIRSHAGEDVKALLERYAIPFVTTMDAKGVITEDHPLSLGVYGTSGDPGAIAAFKDAELVLAMGNSFAQNATYAFAPDLYDGKTLLHINIDPDEIDKVYKATVGLVSDIKPAVAAINKGLECKVGPRLMPKITTDKYVDHPIEQSGSPMHPAALSRAISGMLPANSIILGDAGAHMLWLNCHMSLTKGQLYHNPGSFGPMASHVNGALGIKCANPEKTVVCGCGDGDYLMAGFELLTAVEYDIPVIWVIFNNGEFNIIKQFMVNMYGDHAYMRFANPDYVKYAEACGALGYRVETVEEFEKAFASALASGKPAVIDAVVASEVYPPFNMGRV